MESLPGEIILKVFEYLSPSDLCACDLVAKHFHLYASDQSLWKRLSLQEVAKVCARSSFAPKRQKLLLLERYLDYMWTTSDERALTEEEFAQQSQCTSSLSWKAFFCQYLHSVSLRKKIDMLLLKIYGNAKKNENDSGPVYEYPISQGRSNPPTYIQISSLSCASQTTMDFPLTAFDGGLDDGTLKGALIEFIQLIVEPSLYIPYLLINSVKYDRNTYSLCCSMVDIFTAFGDVFSLLFCSIFDEVLKDVTKLDQSRLFRSESMFNRMLGHYFHLIGGPYLHLALKAPLNKLLNDVMEGTTNEPLHYYQLFLDSILASLPSFPIEIRKICYYLHQEVGSKLPDKANFYVYLILFYRFFCPAIMSYHSLQTTIKTHLVQIAVLLRNEAREAVVPFLAVGSESSSPNPSLRDNKNIENIKKFFAQIVEKPTPTSQPATPLVKEESSFEKGMHVVSSEQLKKAVTQIYHSICSHKNELFVQLLAIDQTEKIHVI